MDFSSLSDKGFEPYYFDPDDVDVQSGDRPSTSSSTISRSDRTPSKFKQKTQKGPNTKQKSSKELEPHLRE